MRFVKMLAASAALAWAGLTGQAQALTIISGTVTTNAFGQAAYLLPNVFGYSYMVGFQASAASDITQQTTLLTEVKSCFDLSCTLIQSSTNVSTTVIGTNTTDFSVVSGYNKAQWWPVTYRPKPIYTRTSVVSDMLLFNAQPDTVISFSGKAYAVPEPATWAMMILGFGAIGFALRQRGALRRCNA